MDAALYRRESRVDGERDAVIQSRFCADSVRANDPDRYLLAMLSPAAMREPLFALYAFNVEIARTREAVSEPPLGEIRLQWWRDAIAALYAGERLRHGVGDALARAIESHRLTRAHFDRLVDARSADLDDTPPDTVAELLRYAEETTVPLLALTLELAGDRSPAALDLARSIGVAWSLLGLIRSLPFHLRARRHYLPRALVARHGVRGLRDLKPSGNLNAAVAELAGEIRDRLDRARADRHAASERAVAVRLQTCLAEIYLRRLSDAGFDPFDPRVAAAPPMVAWRLFLRRLGGLY